ncbi:MAG: AP2 domain-containing protein [Candidatus Omnitrophota bacterium]|jgi:hypothetical protein
MKHADLTGMKFEKLTVLGEQGKYEKNGSILWLCQCECGQTTKATASNLKRGGKKSCGCLLKKEGITHRPEYRCWQNMIKRCTNPSSHNYEYYGGRGIEVCDQWRTFKNFLADMGERPSLLYSVERIDNNGNYEPGNCRWATKTDQNRNIRAQKRSTTGVQGVSFSRGKGKFAARIAVNRKVKHLGYFDTIEEATEARRKGEIEYWGTCKKELREAIKP